MFLHCMEISSFRVDSGGLAQNIGFPSRAAIIRESSLRTWLSKGVHGALEAEFPIFAFPEFGFLRIFCNAPHPLQMGLFLVRINDASCRCVTMATYES